MLVSSFDYDLPPELIAKEPLAGRADSRLLHVNRVSGQLEDQRFLDFPAILRPDDLVVFNNTRVFAARLYGRKKGTNSQGGRIEVLLTRQITSEPNDWQCLVRPGRKVSVEDRLSLGEEGQLQAQVIARGPFGERRLRFDPVEDFLATLDLVGHVPLPPYIDRADGPQDKARYQTIFARERGSIAAPTAGLHFTPEILADMKDLGIETAELTLHVGLGTFQPVRVERVEDHKLHRERFHISPEAAGKINSALDEGRRIIAIGTTTVRTLEYSAGLSPAGRITPGSGEADIFIYPGYRFQVVKGILTNFHLPRSTLLMLVSAFAGREQVLSAYRHAVERRYRFYSYGDCMFLE